MAGTAVAMRLLMLADFVVTQRRMETERVGLTATTAARPAASTTGSCVASPLRPSRQPIPALPTEASPDGATRRLAAYARGQSS